MCFEFWSNHSWNSIWTAVLKPVCNWLVNLFCCLTGEHNFTIYKNKFAPIDFIHWLGMLLCSFWAILIFLSSTKNCESRSRNRTETNFCSLQKVKSTILMHSLHFSLLHFFTDNLKKIPRETRILRRDPTGVEGEKFQFHQNFTRGFFIWKFCAKLFCIYILDLDFFGKRILAQMRLKNVGKIDQQETEEEK